MSCVAALAFAACVLAACGDGSSSARADAAPGSGDAAPLTDGAVGSDAGTPIVGVFHITWDLNDGQSCVMVGATNVQVLIRPPAGTAFLETFACNDPPSLAGDSQHYPVTGTYTLEGSVRADSSVLSLAPTITIDFSQCDRVETGNGSTICVRDVTLVFDVAPG